MILQRHHSQHERAVVMPDEDRKSAPQQVRSARFPGRYVQGPGLIGHLGTELAALSSNALILLDRNVAGTLLPILRASMPVATQAAFLVHRGECSVAEIERGAVVGQDAQCGVVAGVGGGKALDTAKAVAERLGVPAVVVPTIASSDAPCSALAVVYGDDGRVSHDLFLKRNPELVWVDTELICKAPSRFLIAGMGDALATWYEARACRASGAGNCMGLPGAELAQVVAKACCDTLLADGAQALAECDDQRTGPALERVIEANILMSGIGFESGGVACAHAIHHGLCELPQVHHTLHGEKVAVGVLVGLLLEGDTAGFNRIEAFCRSVRLPTSLAELGVSQATEVELRAVADRACRAGDIMHNQPRQVTPEQVVTALKVLALPRRVFGAELGR